jgi:tetratricopeptide (TPR) repeat protein
VVSTGCAGYAEHTRDARSALDRRSPEGALAIYNDALGVSDAKELPEDLGGDNALLILDRAMVLQQLGNYKLSSRDLGVADKQIELLDFSKSALSDVGSYVFSDDTGPYRAPAYEKLMVNTMNMVSYLADENLSGARVEARRLAIMQKHIRDTENTAASLMGPGSYLAGFVFEKSGRADEALRYYDEALEFGNYQSLGPAVVELSKKSSYQTKRLTALQQNAKAPAAEDSAEILTIVNYGRVGARYAKRIPIGLALTYASGAMHGNTSQQAHSLAAQGLVTWINYPELGRAQGMADTPAFALGGTWQEMQGALAVDEEARKAYKAVRGRIIASAITRLISRLIAGRAVQAAAGKDNPVGLLLNLGTQATLTVTDTPDTRSWATLPARIAFGRVRVKPGEHQVVLRARGVERTHTVKVEAGGWAVLNLTVLN